MRIKMLISTRKTRKIVNLMIGHVLVTAESISSIYVRS